MTPRRPMKILAGLFTAALLLTAPGAFARTGSGGKKTPNQVKWNRPPVTLNPTEILERGAEDSLYLVQTGRDGGDRIYDFDDEAVEGEVLRPSGESITGRNPADHPSMIPIRENFLDRLYILTNDLDLGPVTPPGAGSGS